MIIFPRPFAIAIDDLGWMSGQNDGKDGYGPYRTGVDRDMTLADYLAVIDLAKKVGVRLQGLFILGELDRQNILKNIPNSNPQRDLCDNSHNISDLQIEVMDLVKKNASYLEFGLHGIGHEYWPEEGVRKRAEWYNTDDKHPWPEEELIKHVECFIDIMAQYGLSKGNGHSFPESFVPCAYSYYWNPSGAYSLGSVLSKYGVKYANTDFSQIPECDPPEGDNSAGFDHGVNVMNRYNYGNLWDAIGKLPDVALEDQNTDWIETHWPNLLGKTADEHPNITQMWTDYYAQVQRSATRYCAKNTSQHHSQWLYKKYTSIEETTAGTVIIDNRNMPNEAYSDGFPGNMVLKVPLTDGQHLSFASLNDMPIAGYFEDQGFGFLYLPSLEQKNYELSYSLGEKMLTNTVYHDSTSNILDLSIDNNKMTIHACIYGHQEIHVLCESCPTQLTSNNPGIDIIDWHHADGMLSIELKAHDIQGETGLLELIF